MWALWGLLWALLMLWALLLLHCIVVPCAATQMCVPPPPPNKLAQVLTHGFVLDERGNKMSKSVGNVAAATTNMFESLLPPPPNTHTGADARLCAG
jgi:hypothetical protein